MGRTLDHAPECGIQYSIVVGTIADNAVTYVSDINLSDSVTSKGCAGCSHIRPTVPVPNPNYMRQLVLRAIALTCLAAHESISRTMDIVLFHSSEDVPCMDEA